MKNGVVEWQGKLEDVMADWLTDLPNPGDRVELVCTLAREGGTPDGQKWVQIQAKWRVVDDG